MGHPTRLTRLNPPEKNSTRPDPTRPDQVTGQVRAEIFEPKLKKTRSNPKITHKIAGQPDPTRTRPDPTMSWTGHGPIFFDPKLEVNRPEPGPIRQMIRPSVEYQYSKFLTLQPKPSTEGGCAAAGSPHKAQKKKPNWPRALQH
jgi:hypothetical protein